MKLVEFHVGYPAPLAPGGGDSVPSGAIRAAGIEVDLAGAAGGEHHAAGFKGTDVIVVAVQYIGAAAAQFATVVVGLGDQVDNDMVFENLDVGMTDKLFDQGGGYCLAGGIGSMKNTAVTVAALAGQVELSSLVAGKIHAHLDQPVDHRRAVFDSETHGILMAQAAPGDQGVLHMGLHAVLVVQHHGYAALGIPGGTGAEWTFAEHRYAVVVR